MRCPRCGSRTEVNETRGEFRDRRCKNANCGLDFTTREQLMSDRAFSRLCARTRDTINALRPQPPSEVEAQRVVVLSMAGRTHRVGRPRGRKNKVVASAVSSSGQRATDGSALTVPIDGAEASTTEK
jgi:hypothetical protein